MLRQLIDCQEMLGIETKIDEEDLNPNENLDDPGTFEMKRDSAKESKNSDTP